MLFLLLFYGCAFSSSYRFSGFNHFFNVDDAGVFLRHFCVSGFLSAAPLRALFNSSGDVRLNSKAIHRKNRRWFFSSTTIAFSFQRPLPAAPVQRHFHRGRFFVKRFKTVFFTKSNCCVTSNQPPLPYGVMVAAFRRRKLRRGL